MRRTRKVFSSNRGARRKDIQPFAPEEQQRKWPFGVVSRFGHAEILSSPSIAFSPELFYVVVYSKTFAATKARKSNKNKKSFG